MEHILCAKNLSKSYTKGFYALNNISLEDAIPEELQIFIISIIGEGRASIYNHETEQWLGNLNELEFGSGYWIETSVSIPFYWQSHED